MRAGGRFFTTGQAGLRIGTIITRAAGSVAWFFIPGMWFWRHGPGIRRSGVFAIGRAMCYSVGMFLRPTWLTCQSGDNSFR
jgi:hypothetical protein